MKTYTGTIQAKRRPRQPSAQNPLAFRYTATVQVEAPQDTPEAQAARAQKWADFLAWVLAKPSKVSPCV